MAGRPGYGPSDPQNPFAGASAPYTQPLRQYSANIDESDPYASRNASSVPLTQPGFYDESAPQCESAFVCKCRNLRRLRESI